MSGGNFCAQLTPFAGPVGPALGQMPDGTLIYAYRLQQSAGSEVLRDVWLTNYGARLISWMGLPKIQIVMIFIFICSSIMM
jgi:hypothetical protein